MVVYAIDSAKKDLTDKTRMIVCSVEVPDQKSKYGTFKIAANSLREADIYNKADLYITKKYFDEVYSK